MTEAEWLACGPSLPKLHDNRRDSWEVGAGLAPGAAVG